MNYNSDTPILSTEENKLNGRDEYAKNIARAISELKNDQSFVVALYSKWGYGKTSVMNMVKQKLEENKTIFCMDLIPWDFTSSEEIVRQLFLELARKYNNHRPRRLFWKSRKYIEPTIESVSEILKILNPSCGLVLGTSNGFISRTHIGSYQKIRLKLEEEIQKEKNKIVVFIDDIDRLDAKGVLDTFKLIKSVANIKGVVFFLAFDYEVVAGMLDKIHETEKGRDFINKIVQIPLELPYIDRAELDDLLICGLNEILSRNKVKIPSGSNQNTSFGLLYEDIKKYIDTPRTIVRFLNVMEFVVPMVKDEVNIFDMVCLEMIRAIKPKLHKIIRENKAILTDYSGIETASFFTKSREEKKKTISNIFQDDEEYIKIASHLFPIVRSECYNRSDFRDSSQNNRTMKKICSAAYFDRYFSYSIGKNDVADSVFTSIMKKPKIMQQDIAEILQSPNQIDRFLEKISDSPECIFDKHGLCFELVLFLETQKQAYEKSNIFFTNIERALYTINKLLLCEPYSSENNLETYLKIANNVSLRTLTYSIRSVDIVNRDEKDDSKRTLNEKDFSKYKQEIIRLIQDKMQKDELPITEYGTITKELYKYSSIFSGNTKGINAYMKKNVKTADGAIDFISQFLSGWTEVGDGVTHRSDLFDNDFATYRYWFTNDFDAKYLYDLIIKSKKYAKYKNVPLEDIKRFDRLAESVGEEDINREGKEQSDDFRKVIAQQFIYIFNSNINKNSQQNDAVNG